MRAQIRRLERWWSEDLWALTQADHDRKSPGETPLKHALGRLSIHAARSIYIVATGFRRERIKLRASQLTYVSLLSLVPALVVVFSLFTALGGLGDVKDWVKRFVISSLAVSQQDLVMGYVDGFLDAAGAVGGFGILFLIITVISLLTNVERAFNDIWGLTRHRTILQRFQVYWPLITIVPILMGLSLSFTAAVEANRYVMRIEKFAGLVGFGYEIVPFVLTVAWLTLLYMLLPNTRVPARFAVIGAFVAGLLWEAAKILYAHYASFILSRPSIYGSLAAVPLFILWLYVSWMLALVGATLTFAVQNAKTYEPEGVRDRPQSQRDKELLAVQLMIAIAERYARGEGPLPAQGLLDRVSVQPRFARRVLAELAESGLAVETAAGRDEVAYVPGKPIEAIAIADIIRAMRRGAHASEVSLEGDPAAERVLAKLIEAEESMEASLGAMPLIDLTKPDLTRRR